MSMTSNVLYKKAYRNSKSARGWSGKNKAITREIKLSFVRSFSFENPICLTLPGTGAKFESMLIAAGLVDPANLVGIQSQKGKKNFRIYREVCRKAREVGFVPYGGEMSFLLGAEYPSYVRNGCYGRSRVLKKLVKGVNVFDLDTVNSIGEEMFRALRGMFEYKVPSECLPSAVMINNVRSRYKPSGVRSLYRILLDYKKVVGESLTLTKNIIDKKCRNKQQLLLFFMPVPTAYSCLAAKFGYALKIEKMIAYEDKNQSTNKGGAMAQFLFSCTRTNDKDMILATLDYNQMKTKEAILTDYMESQNIRTYDNGGIYSKYTD